MTSPNRLGATIGAGIDALTNEEGQTTLCVASADKGGNDIAADRKKPTSGVGFLPFPFVLRAEREASWRGWELSAGESVSGHE
jgi:hypothetical protein